MKNTYIYIVIIYLLFVKLNCHTKVRNDIFNLETIDDSIFDDKKPKTENFADYVKSLEQNNGKIQLINHDNSNWLLEHSCSDMKKFNREKDYCQLKKNIIGNSDKGFSLDNNTNLSDSTIHCLKNFCSVCCNENNSCQESCYETKKYFNDNTTDNLNSVCDYKNMFPTFDKYCSFFVEFLIT